MHAYDRSNYLLSAHLYIDEMHRQGKLVCIQQAVLITVSQSPNLDINHRTFKMFDVKKM